MMLRNWPHVCPYCCVMCCFVWPKYDWDVRQQLEVLLYGTMLASERSGQIDTDLRHLVAAQGVGAGSCCSTVQFGVPPVSVPCRQWPMPTGSCTSCRPRDRPHSCGSLSDLAAKHVA